MIDKKQPKPKTTIEKIVALMPRLSCEDFMGLAIVLSVKTLTDTWDKETKKAIPRDAGEIVSDCINTINSMEENEQKFYYKLIKKAASRRR